MVKMDENKNTVQAAGTGKDNRALIILAIIVLALVVLFVGNPPLVNSVFPEEAVPEPPEPVSMVELYHFDDLYGNNTVNVELWLMNIGDGVAKNITTFVRVRGDTGGVLFSQNLSLTALVLFQNQTCSAVYTVNLQNSTRTYHTIEVSWDGGRNSYTRTSVKTVDISP